MRPEYKLQTGHGAKLIVIDDTVQIIMEIYLKL